MRGGVCFPWTQQYCYARDTRMKICGKTKKSKTMRKQAKLYAQRNEIFPCYKHIEQKTKD